MNDEVVFQADAEGNYWPHVFVTDSSGQEIKRTKGKLNEQFSFRTHLFSISDDKQYKSLYPLVR